LNRLRRKRASTGELDLTTLAVASEEIPYSALESEEAACLKSKVWAAVERLSAAQRATVLLFYRQEFTCQEIACVLELPVATVKSHLHRARLRLRGMLESVEERELQSFRNFAG
jgi:RNA polymerase sigma-70 factor (ECF subfamily)